jgi:hypothetical protein
MNNPLETSLWENIRTFAFDDPASNFPFSKKLQKENNWSSSFTNEAIEEYRKFIFLCCILPDGASPSETVDKVWHLHLTYTTNYWIHFCKNTLQKDIHHYPSKGGSEEQTKHTDWYQQTLSKYKEVFETTPPAAIWPENATEEKQVDFEIYDKELFNRSAILFAILTILFVLITGLFKSSGPDFLGYYFMLMIAGTVVAFILQQHKAKKLDQYLDDHFPKNFNAYQIARYLYGLHRAYQTALVDLLKRDIIDVSGNQYKISSIPYFDFKTESNPLLPNITEILAARNTFTYGEGFDLMDNGKLQHPELDELTRLSKLVDYQKFVIPGIVLAIGFARLLQGMANEKPVGYLVAEIGFFSLIALMIAAQYSYTYLVFKKSETIWMNQTNNGYSNDVLNNFTILGTLAVSGFAEYNALTNVFESEAPNRRTTDDGGLAGSSSGCSSSGDNGGGCSGGDGGGGCGGCGGGD